LNGCDNINQVNDAQDANQYLLHRVHSNGVTGKEGAEVYAHKCLSSSVYDTEEPLLISTVPFSWLRSSFSGIHSLKFQFYTKELLMF